MYTIIIYKLNVNRYEQFEKLGKLNRISIHVAIKLYLKTILTLGKINLQYCY